MEMREGREGVCGDVFPKNRAIFVVVLDSPNTGCGLNQYLIAVVVKLRNKFHTRRRGERGVGDGDVLVELICHVDGIGAALARGFAVADVVEVVSVAAC